MTEAYCLRCKTNRTVVDPVVHTTANGKQQLRGTCAACGTRVFRFVKRACRGVGRDGGAEHDGRP